MAKSKIIVDHELLDQIANSSVMSENEKLSFLKVIGYMTAGERQQLASLI